MKLMNYVREKLHKNENENVNDELNMSMKFEDSNGDIHIVSYGDFDSFDEAMGHKDWCLVFD